MAPKDYRCVLSKLDKRTGKYMTFGKTKSFKMDAEFEAFYTIENRDRLIRGAASKIPLVQTKFQLTGTQAVDPNQKVVNYVKKLWGPTFDKRIVNEISEDFIETLPHRWML